MADSKTKSQEEGSMWIMKRVLNGNVKYNSPEDIMKDVKYNELKKIFKKSNQLDSSGNVPFDWIKSYYKQQEAMLKKYQPNSFTEFKYDGRGSFNDYIKKLYFKYRKGRYETWNPADIWIVNGRSSEIKKKIDKEVSGSIATQNISRLNSILRKLFKEKKVIGISLKKVTGKYARFEEVNIDINQVLEIGKFNESLEITKMNFDLRVVDSNFKTKDLLVTLDGSKSYTFQIKSNPPNLKFESSVKGSGGRLGKAEVKKVSELIEVYSKTKFHNNYKNHPKNVSEFENQKEKYGAIFDEIKNKVTTNLNDKEDFYNHLRSGFVYNPETANIKLLIMSFLSSYYKIPENNRSDFWIDMLWLSEKKGAGFGPHGKLY